MSNIRRIPKFLSPSNALLAGKDPDEWYMKYASPNKPIRFPQTEAMCVGSAFDSYIKAAIAEDLQMESRHSDHSFEKLFTESVETHNLDFARKAGRVVFDAYLRSAYPALIAMLQRADGVPYMESSMGKTIDGVPLFGKPDLLCVIKETPVILDWKVNGYMSARNTSPKKGFCAVWDNDKKFGESHKDATTLPSVVPNIIVNKTIGHGLPADWDMQTSTYCWLILESVPSTPYIKMIDQVCGPKNKLRFARHSYESIVANDLKYMEYYTKIWDVLSEGTDEAFATMGVDAKALDLATAMMSGNFKPTADAGLEGLSDTVTPTDGELFSKGRTQKPY